MLPTKKSVEAMSLVITLPQWSSVSKHQAWCALRSVRNEPRLCTSATFPKNMLGLTFFFVCVCVSNPEQIPSDIHGSKFGVFWLDML